MRPIEDKSQFPVLVAEDSRSSQMLLEAHLKRAGFSAVVVDNGRQALRAFEDQFFPIVITDWMMPEINGLELCKAIRRKKTPGYVYIMLLTSKDSREDIVTGLAAGADDFLVKPFNKGELLARMETGMRIFNLEKSLVAARNYTENIIDSMVDALVVLNPDMTIRKVNNAACNLFGYGESELIDQSAHRFLPASLGLADMVKKNNEGRFQIRDQEARLNTRAAETITISYNVSVLYEHSKGFSHPDGLIFVARDITPRKKAEEGLKRALKELQQTKDMLVQSEKLAAIGRLSAGVSHEILNPTNIINLRLQLLGMTESLSDKAKAAIDICREQLRRIVDITKDLGRFSRTHGKQIAVVDINETLDRILSLYKPQFRLDDITVAVQYDDGLSKIRLDKDAFEEVIFNLIANASSAMSQETDRRIRLETSRPPSGKGVRIRVSDSGPGIDPADLNRVFDPYFTTKAPDEGTGLGLFICHGIIQEMGGAIWAENNDRRGVSFYIDLPDQPRPNT